MLESTSHIELAKQLREARLSRLSPGSEQHGNGEATGPVPAGTHMSTFGARHLPLSIHLCISLETNLFTSISMMHFVLFSDAGSSQRPGLGSLLNLLLPLIAGAAVHAVAVMSSFPSLAAVVLCLFSLVETSCISAGERLHPYVFCFD